MFKRSLLQNVFKFLQQHQAIYQDKSLIHRFDPFIVPSSPIRRHTMLRKRLSTFKIRHCSLNFESAFFVMSSNKYQSNSAHIQLEPWCSGMLLRFACKRPGFDSRQMLLFFVIFFSSIFIF